MDIKTALSNIRLSKNFTALEFANTEDGYAIKLPDISLVNKLQIIRDKFGPIKITSATRTVEYNARCGGSKNSYHLDGLAVDVRFYFKGKTRESLVNLMKEVGFKNVGFYWNKDKTLNRMHLDVGLSRSGTFHVFDKQL